MSRQGVVDPGLAQGLHPPLDGLGAKLDVADPLGNFGDGIATLLQLVTVHYSSGEVPGGAWVLFGGAFPGDESEFFQLG